MLPLRQVGQNQSVPVGGQSIGAAVIGKGETGSPLRGLHQQMDLRVVPEGFKVSHALHRIIDGLPVHDGPLSEADGAS